MYLRVNLLGPGPRLMKKEFTGPRSQRLTNTDLNCLLKAADIWGGVEKSACMLLAGVKGREGGFKMRLLNLVRQQIVENNSILTLSYLHVANTV